MGFYGKIHRNVVFFLYSLPVLAKFPQFTPSVFETSKNLSRMAYNAFDRMPSGRPPSINKSQRVSAQTEKRKRHLTHFDRF